MKVLVAYASRRGSTAGIAEAIADGLRREGLEVDCEAVQDVGSLRPYEAVVLGTAMYARRWRGEASQFLRQHSWGLARLPLWIFSSGPVGDPDEEQPEWNEPPSLVEAAAELGVYDHIVFGGCLPSEPRGPIERAMVASTPPEHRDRRDWNEIRGWTMSIAAELLAVASIV